MQRHRKCEIVVVNKIMARRRNKDRLNVLLTGDPVMLPPYPIEEALTKYREVVFWEEQSVWLSRTWGTLMARVRVIAAHGGRVRYHTFGPKDTKPQNMVVWP